MNSSPVETASTASTASMAADAAAARAGVAIREVQAIEELRAVRGIFDTIWSVSATNPSMTAELMRAYAHSGQYVVVATDTSQGSDGEILGASVGFLAAPIGRALHSHITGVLPVGRARGLGLALKLHQRAWALDRGLDLITWTFDPLIRRNAWFNLTKLGARVDEYLVDFYGAMSDGINAGDESDRLHVVWSLHDAAGPGSEPVDVLALRARGAQVAIEVGSDGGPVAASAIAPGAQTPRLVQIPPDVESLRRGHPGRHGAAAAWRHAVREVLTTALDGGYRVTGFGRDGWYVLEHH